MNLTLGCGTLDCYYADHPELDPDNPDNFMGLPKPDALEN